VVVDAASDVKARPQSSAPLLHPWLPCSEPSMYPTMFRVKTPCSAAPSLPPAATPPPLSVGTPVVCLQRAEHVPDHVPREDPLRRRALPLWQGHVLPHGDGTARCTCPSGFVEKIESSVPKCATASPCASPINPCAIGVCSNEFDGTYTCRCPSVSAPHNLLHTVQYTLGYSWDPTPANASASFCPCAPLPSQLPLQCPLKPPPLCVPTCAVQGTVVGSRADGGETCVVNSFQSGLVTTTALAGDNCSVSTLASVTVAK